MLDVWHNDETPVHYTWDDDSSGGYSQFGQVFTDAGATLSELHEAITEQTISDADVFVIVDPDTPKERDEPRYFTTDEIDALADWVGRGGVLIMMANNMGNTEFKHFNQLAERFGIQFNEDTLATDQPTFQATWQDVNFNGLGPVHIVGMCSLSVSPPAKAVGQVNGQVFAATAKVDQGQVFAAGDPWFYNEYINHGDNYRIAERLAEWALKNSSGGKAQEMQP